MAENAQRSVDSVPFRRRSSPRMRCRPEWSVVVLAVLSGLDTAGGWTIPHAHFESSLCQDRRGVPTLSVCGRVQGPRRGEVLVASCCAMLGTPGPGVPWQHAGDPSRGWGTYASRVNDKSRESRLDRSSRSFGWAPRACCPVLPRRAAAGTQATRQMCESAWSRSARFFDALVRVLAMYVRVR